MPTSDTVICPNCDQTEGKCRCVSTKGCRGVPHHDLCPDGDDGPTVTQSGDGEPTEPIGTPAPGDDG